MVFTKKHILQLTEGRCFYCGCGLTVATMTRDHVYPKLRGGAGRPFNLVASCGPCNWRKGSKLPTHELVEYVRGLYKKQAEARRARRRALPSSVLSVSCPCLSVAK